MPSSEIREDIENALGAHALWKMRLRAAIHQGKIETAVADIARDDRCEFGKWLYGPAVPNNARASSHFATVVRLHAEFHKVAAQIAELAVSGSKEAATKRLNSGDYTRTSEELARAMRAWRDAAL